MDKTAHSAENKYTIVKAVFFAILAAFGITAVALLLLAAMVFRLELSVQTVDVGILIIYTMGALIAGAVTGRRICPPQYTLGFLAGGLYFMLLLAGSLLFRGELTEGTMSLLTIFVICTSSGILGVILAQCFSV